jgi:hypothetical protein
MKLMAQDKEEWLAFVTKAMNIWVPENVGKLLSS